MNDYRITIRSVGFETAEQFREQASALGMTLGETFGLAIETLERSLGECEDTDQLDCGEATPPGIEIDGIIERYLV